MHLHPAESSASPFDTAKSSIQPHSATSAASLCALQLRKACLAKTLLFWRPYLNLQQQSGSTAGAGTELDDDLMSKAEVVAEQLTKIYPTLRTCQSESVLDVRTLLGLAKGDDLGEEYADIQTSWRKQQDKPPELAKSLRLWEPTFRAKRERAVKEAHTLDLSNLETAEAALRGANDLIDSMYGAMTSSEHGAPQSHEDATDTDKGTLMSRLGSDEAEGSTDSPVSPLQDQGGRF